MNVRVQIHPGNSHIIHIDGLRDLKAQIETGSVTWINDATVQLLSIGDSDGTLMPGNFPYDADYVDNSDGDYIAPLPSSLPFLIGKTYTFEIKATIVGGEAVWYPQGKAVRRP